jgi:hypothetical protein
VIVYVGASDCFVVRSAIIVPVFLELNVLIKLFDMGWGDSLCSLVALDQYLD